MNPTNIEYLTHTWNPISMRCTPVGPGCAHCWHIQMADRLASNPKIPECHRRAYNGEGAPILIQKRLDALLKHKKPARIGVQFMGDLFHDQITYEQQVEIFTLIAEASWHTFLILTKRPKNMFDFIQSIEDWEWYHFQHVWWGISAENQQTLDDRASILLQIPAAKRFVSIEPMLGPVDLCVPYGQGVGDLLIENLDWVIIGGLSLPGGKVVPPDPKWIDSIVEQCDNSEIPIFIKENARHYTRYALQPERQEFPR